jgi:peptidoglycan-associated lipoprotein
MKKVFIVLLLVFAVGCSTKYLKPGHDTTETGDGTVVAEKEVVGEQVYMGDEDGEVSSETEALTEGTAIAKDVLFDYDKYDIKPEARPILDSVASWMNSNAGLNVTIEGHCDERGTNEYNLALGEKRAKSARDYLVSLGVSSSRMGMITYGEENPVCVQKNEACWQKNRRAHFIIIK